MKNKTAQIKNLSLASLASLSLLAGCCTWPDQSEFPAILRQPEDQLVKIGARASFSVQAKNGPLTYQWVRNGSALAGQTKSELVIPNAQIGDVGFYSCKVAKGFEVVPTRGASLMVYTNTTDARTGIDPVYVYASPVVSSGSKGTCPGSYAGYVSYTKTVAQGWGWPPDTNTTVHTASDTNRTDTKVEYTGKSGDSGCAQTTVTVPHPPTSTKYRFTIYFPNNVPTNSYAIVLDGFNP